MGSIPVSGRFPGGGHCNPVQYSCLENPMDRGAWWAKVCKVTKSWTRLKQLSTHATVPEEWAYIFIFLWSLVDPTVFRCFSSGFLCTLYVLHWLALIFVYVRITAGPWAWSECVLGFSLSLPVCLDAQCLGAGHSRLSLVLYVRLLSHPSFCSPHSTSNSMLSPLHIPTWVISEFLERRSS